MRILTLLVVFLHCCPACATIVYWYDSTIASWSATNPTVAQASTSLISGSTVTFKNVDEKGINMSMKLLNNASGEVFNALGPGVTYGSGDSLFDHGDVIGMNMQHPLQTENTNFRFRVSFSTPLTGSIGFANNLSPVNRLVFGSDHWSYIPPVTYTSIGNGEIMSDWAVQFVNGTTLNPRFQNATYVDWGFDGSTSTIGTPTMWAGFNLDITTVPEPQLGTVAFWLTLTSAAKYTRRVRTKR
jgi:hypothetical protein